jgi:putative oxidoreductase
MDGIVRLLKRPATLRVVRIALGIVVAWAALAKLSDLAAFSAQVHNFRVLPIWSENLVAMTLPWIELVAALSLLLGIQARSGALVATGLLAVFTVAVALAVARGLDFQCGCFGTADATRVGWGKLLQNTGLLAVGAVAALRERA